MNVQEYLGRQVTPFDVIDHAATYDAQHLAAALHESGCHVAKTVLLHAGKQGRYLIAVLPATKDVDLEKVKHVLNCDEATIATEEEVAKRFPDCEAGVVPPFGAHYGLKTLVDVVLSREEDIVFEGATHSQAIKLKFKDYQQLEQPMVVSFVR